MAQDHAKQLAQLRSAIAAMPQAMRTAYQLHLFEALDYRAIAAQLGTDARSVEQLIALAIIHIERSLRPSGD